ncbi:hypothetical protein [Holophaga foetida]|uniref:hypothetical protein n=1 Tax=Holophaga foetida TaxID=35839 RepID=UPI0002474D4B|nr:hypothetical protein [Holophaga foetida]
MLKLAVIGAQTLLGRELVGALEPQDCSVLPLSTGALTVAEEEGDLVVFAPTPELLEEIEIVILADAPKDPAMLDGFTGRILDLRHDSNPKLEPMPLVGEWVEGHTAYRARPALEQVLGLLPHLVSDFSDVAGTHLRSVGHMGDQGLDGLMQQSVDMLQGNDPDTGTLGYRAAFEVIPQAARGNLVEVKVPVFHGEILILHLRAAEGASLKALEAPLGVKWIEHPPSSREVAVTAELLAHLSLGSEGRTGVLTLGFDPILWGILRPTLRILGLA